MLKLFADECIHADLISAIKKRGFDIITVKDAGLNGASDDQIFKFALKNQRILLTFDREFGDVFRFNISHTGGIIIILIEQLNHEDLINIILNFLSFINPGDIDGKLVIVGRNRIRIIDR